MKTDPLKKTRRGHGGDIYSDPDRAWIDLSANINPHALPQALYEALPQILEEARAYPDIEYRELRRLLANHASSQGKRRIPPAWIIPGNGAVELLDKTIRTFRKGLLVQPCFSEYELAFVRYGIPYIILGRRPETAGLLGRGLRERICDLLTKDPTIDSLVLCNPNNPDGARWDSLAFASLLEFCRERSVTVLLDETFGEYLEHYQMMLPMVKDYDNLIVVKAMTKFFGLPGVRLGYAISGDAVRRKAISDGLTTWNVGVFELGIARIFLRDKAFIRASRQENAAERDLLQAALQAGPWFTEVYRSSANFILVASPRINAIIQGLKGQGILIRDLSDLRGLGPGYARIAVKAGTRPALLEALRQLDV